MAMASTAAMLLLRRAMATAAEATLEVVKKKPMTGSPKKKNLFDVARLLPGWGVGHKVAKSHWKPETYYKLCDIKLRKVREKDPVYLIVYLIVWLFFPFSRRCTCAILLMVSWWNFNLGWHASNI
jgi:hypothetical protein